MKPEIVFIGGDRFVIRHAEGPAVIDALDVGTGNGKKGHEVQVTPAGEGDGKGKDEG